MTDVATYPVPIKSKWESKGFVGGVVAAAATLATVVGVPDLAVAVGFESLEAITDFILKGAAIGGAVLAAYGRLTAKHTLT
jgi:hypothetical protein